MASRPEIKKTLQAADSWKSHDAYGGTRHGSTVTRSQTVFCRIKNSDSDLELFGDPLRHAPPDKPHLMVAMKGKMGSIPRTIITRSVLRHLEISQELCQRLDEYKDEDLKKRLIRELKAYQKEHMKKAPAHDEEEISDAEALEVLQKKQENEAMEKEQKPVTQAEHLKQINDADDFYTEHKNDIDAMQ